MWINTKYYINYMYTNPRTDSVSNTLKSISYATHTNLPNKTTNYMNHEKAFYVQRKIKHRNKAPAISPKYREFMRRTKMKGIHKYKNQPKMVSRKKHRNKTSSTRKKVARKINKSMNPFQFHPHSPMELCFDKDGNLLQDARAYLFYHYIINHKRGFTTLQELRRMNSHNFIRWHQYRFGFTIAEFCADLTRVIRAFRYASAYYFTGGLLHYDSAVTSPNPWSKLH